MPRGQQKCRMESKSRRRQKCGLYEGNNMETYGSLIQCTTPAQAVHIAAGTVNAYVMSHCRASHGATWTRAARVLTWSHLVPMQMADGMKV